jgi:hypothetical protein
VDRRWRRGLWSVVGVQAAFALGFAFEVEPVLELWPFGGGRFTMLFLASIFAAAAASTAWCLARDVPRAFAGIALDYLVILGPLAVYSFVRAVDEIDYPGRVAGFGVACLLGAGGGVLLLREARRHEWRNDRRTPSLVLWSFGVFLAALVVVSALLIARRSVLPWPVTDDQSTVIGLMFLGAAAYFAYGLVERRWENAGGQLAGFLAYDLVLIGPFFGRLPDSPDEFRTELVVYTAVVVYSGLLAAFYLFVNRATRVTAALPLPAD